MYCEDCVERHASIATHGLDIHIHKCSFGAVQKEKVDINTIGVPLICF